MTGTSSRAIIQMSPSLRQEFTFALQEIIYTIIPLPSQRTPIDGHVLSVLIPLHFLPVVFMAYLARRPDTYLIRLLLLPVTILSTTHIGFAYQYVHPMLNVYNFGLALCVEVMLSKVFLWALTPEGMLKRDEVAPSIPRHPNSTPKGHEAPAITQPNGEVEVSFDLRKKDPPSPVWDALRDAFELMWTLRGQDFEYSKDTTFPPPTRPQTPRSAFLKATLKSFVINFLVLDCLESFLKLVPGVGDPGGGSMFLESLTPIPRYVLATTLHFMTGVCLLAGFNMVYDLVTLFSVGALDVSPSYYPPVFNGPFTSESLHEFWSKRWHQLLRQTFVVLGGWPLSFLLSLPFRTLNFKRAEKITSDLGLLFGTFLASGLFHETSIYTMGQGIDLLGPTVLFFGAQGPLLILERVWRAVTGRRIGGWLGIAWVWLVIVGGGQGMIDSWHQRGLGGGMVIFPWISPARLILLPLIQQLLTYLPK